MRALEPNFEVFDIAHLRKEKRAGAYGAFERLRCAEGAVRPDCAERPDLSLRDIADPTRRGLSHPGMEWPGPKAGC